MSRKLTVAACTMLATACGRIAFDPIETDATQGSGDAGVGLRQQAYIKASNTDAGDHFGPVVTSADGNTLVVSAVNESSGAVGIDGNQADNSVSRAGAVYVFRRSQGVWTQEAYLKASNTNATDLFGSDIAVSDDGNTLAIGAFYEDSAATGVNGNQLDNSAGESGAVYMFVRSGSTWSQQAYLKASNAETSDVFGEQVALSGDGNVLAVTALNEDSSSAGVDGNQADNSTQDSGAVYMFTRTGTVWAQQSYLKASNPGFTDGFGIALALSSDGTTIAISARHEDSAATGIGGNQNDDSALESGAVYVFVRSGATWAQQAYVKASNTDAGDLFGSGLAISVDGNTLAVGAPGEASAARGIGGDQNDNTAAGAGAVYVFARSGVSWAQQAYIKAFNADAGDGFGAPLDLSLDGNLLLVGAGGESSAAVGVDGDPSSNAAPQSGAGYLFTRVGTTWTQSNYLKASNTEAGDQFGGVGISGDGATLILGSVLEDSNATGIDGNQADNSAVDSGAVYVFGR